MYRFINEHRTVWGVMTMCRVLNVARAGFYAWLHNPVSARDKDNQRLLTLIDLFARNMVGWSMKPTLSR